MTAFYPNPCYSKRCHKGSALNNGYTSKFSVLGLVSVAEQDGKSYLALNLSFPHIVAHMGLAVRNLPSGCAPTRDCIK